MTDRAQLAAYIAAELKDEPKGLPLATIARRLGTRPATVRAVLRADSGFVRTGSTSGARWHLVAVPSRSVPFRPEPSNLVGQVLSRLDAIEARLDVLERRNGAAHVRVHPPPRFDGGGA